MEIQNLPGFGQESKDLKFDNFWDWLIAYNDVGTMWRAQPTYIIVQVLYLTGGLITLFHAIKNGGRYLHLWVAILLHGFVVEAISYNLPDIDNFWHSQTPIMLLGRRLPFYILIVCMYSISILHGHVISLVNGSYKQDPVFLYNASIAAKKLNLPNWSEPFAVGLLVVLIDIPYDIMSVRFLHWTWHDTDPNVFDRHYHVPWNSYYFHSTFAASFTFWFHGTRRLITKNADKWSPSKSFFKESLCTTLAAVLGMPGGVLLFLPIYHPLHDNYNIHSEVTFFLLFSVFIILAWSGERSKSRVTQSVKNTIDHILLGYLAVHYSIFLSMAMFGDPAKEVSIGIHEPIGPCNETVAITSALGQILYKQKYLCAEENDEAYFGWSCLPKGKPPSSGSHWYTACGTPLTNRAEYITVILTICIIAAGVFMNVFLWPNEINGKGDSKKSSQTKTVKKIKSS